MERAREVRGEQSEPQRRRDTEEDRGLLTAWARTIGADGAGGLQRSFAWLRMTEEEFEI
jgi:hypothetical protein